MSDESFIFYSTSEEDISHTSDISKVLVSTIDQSKIHDTTTCKSV